jgi:hypothetical protein
MLLVTVREWYPTKRPKHCDHFQIYCASPSVFCLFVIHPLELSGKYEQTTSSETGETLRENEVNFANEISLPYSAGLFNMP